ncbi:MAG: methylenetetrahydrofolate reductase [NAD(P)H] [Wenzhouxiangellaceae bacterium]
MKLSFEFFPPRDDAQQAVFRAARDRLAALGPEYMSVTFGAGGSTLGRTRRTVLEIQAETGIPAAPHLSCMVESRESLDDLLDSYSAHGIQRLVVLRGDRPSGGGHGIFDHAVDLVGYIRQRHGDRFRIEVACYPELHPESPDIDSELAHFEAKVRAGADAAITQYFYNADAYFRFVDDCSRRGIDIPIVPGIMPITNYAALARFSAACGAELPAWIEKRIAVWDRQGRRDCLRAFGEDVVTGLCERLLAGGAPGLHFYTLNRARATLAICRNLGLGKR